jgi:Holliday junction resolvase RusA-like endonuclease
MADPIYPEVTEQPELNRCEVWLSGKVESWKRNRVHKGRTFRDPKGLAYRKALAAAARIACPGALKSPVAVEMLVVYPRPKTRPSDVPAEIWNDGGEILRPTRNRDDIDRLQGNVLDALSDAGVIVDDGAVVDMRARKVWAKVGGQPGLLLRVIECGWVSSK